MTVIYSLTAIVRYANPAVGTSAFAGVAIGGHNGPNTDEPFCIYIDDTKATVVRATGWGPIVEFVAGVGTEVTFAHTRVGVEGIPTGAADVTVVAMVEVGLQGILVDVDPVIGAAVGVVVTDIDLAPGGRRGGGVEANEGGGTAE